MPSKTCWPHTSTLLCCEALVACRQACCHVEQFWWGQHGIAGATESLETPEGVPFMRGHQTTRRMGQAPVGLSFWAAAAVGEVASCSCAMTMTSGRRWLKALHSRRMDCATRRSTASRVASQGSLATAVLAACPPHDTHQPGRHAQFSLPPGEAETDVLHGHVHAGQDFCTEEHAAPMPHMLCSR